MQQKEFSDYVMPKIIKHFPQFQQNYKSEQGGIIETELVSTSGELYLWLTTQNIEITIGLSGKVNMHDWHTHITPYQFDDLEADVIIPTIDMIDSIISDKQIICKSSLTGYRCCNHLLDYKEKPGEKFEILKWSDA